jgi:mannan endo-1,4-beta-mannosidase
MQLNNWQENKFLMNKLKIMKFKRKNLFLLIIALCMIFSSLPAQDFTSEPVTPKASPETRALLKLLYGISGHYTLTGQHNYPNIKDRNSRFAAGYTGKTPAVFSTDWGFAKDGDTDSYLARPDIVNEAIRQHQLGSIITICWHAVPPTADEPITFRPQPGANPDSLASVQGQLQDQQFMDILIPGTKLYKKWCTQVDTIACYLKKLQEAHVPILWRPYHEMNGDWFWWGGRVGKYSTIALYRQLFDRLVNHHKLTNLIWIWSVDRPNKPGMQFSNFYPGNEYLDILSLDVYRNDFNKINYDSLEALSAGKPLVLAEVGNPPSPEIFQSQPKWGFYVIWAGMVRNTLKKQYQNIVNDPRVLSLEDPMYREIMTPYHVSCGLPPLTEPVKMPVDFSGEWMIDEEKSLFDNFGASNLPYKITVVQNANELTIKRTILLEYADDRIIEEKLVLDGKDSKSEFQNYPQILTAQYTEGLDTLVINSKNTIQRGDRTFEMLINEIWTIKEQGSVLSIQQYSSSFRGEQNITMVFERQ